MKGRNSQIIPRIKADGVSNKNADKKSLPVLSPKSCVKYSAFGFTNALKSIISAIKNTTKTGIKATANSKHILANRWYLAAFDILSEKISSITRSSIFLKY